MKLGSERIRSSLTMSASRCGSANVTVRYVRTRLGRSPSPLSCSLRCLLCTDHVLPYRRRHRTGVLVRLSNGEWLTSQLLVGLLSFPCAVSVRSASIVLGQLITRRRSMFRDARVVELGCGAGLAGVVASVFAEYAFALDCSAVCSRHHVTYRCRLPLAVARPPAVTCCSPMVTRTFCPWLC
jgi:hypothetical protein